MKSLASFLAGTESLAALCGAGVSTASGIPDYRDRNGDKKHTDPIQYGDFIAKPGYRRRYWELHRMATLRSSQAERGALRAGGTRKFR